MTTDEKLDKVVTVMERITGTLDTVTGILEAHNNQIAGLLTLAEKHEKAIADLSVQWQAYLNTIHPKQ